MYIHSAAGLKNNSKAEVESFEWLFKPGNILSSFELYTSTTVQTTLRLYIMPSC